MSVNQVTNVDFSIAFLHIGKIITLTDAEKEIFSSLAQVITIKRKSFLLQEGQICRYDYFVLKGCLRSFYTDEQRKEHTTLFAIEGWWTGNLKSFVREIPAEIAIEALETTTVLRLSKLCMEELFMKVPKFERYFRILLQNRLLAVQDRLFDHLSAPASEKYKQFSVKYPTMEQRVPLKYIASYLGITPTYLSRLRKKRMKA